MGRRKKGAVRTGHGVMCNVCGINCGKGGALKKHVEGAHRIRYHHYKKCFYENVSRIIADSWDGSVATTSGKTVMIHVLVRRFVGSPGKRGVTRAARVTK